MGNFPKTNVTKNFICCYSVPEKLDNYEPKLKRNILFQNDYEENTIENVKPEKKYITPYSDSDTNVLYTQINYLIKIQKAYRRYSNRKKLNEITNCSNTNNNYSNSNNSIVNSKTNIVQTKENFTTVISTEQNIANNNYLNIFKNYSSKMNNKEDKESLHKKNLEESNIRDDESEDMKDENLKNNKIQRNSMPYINIKYSSIPNKINNLSETQYSYFSVANPKNLLRSTISNFEPLSPRIEREIETNDEIYGMFLEKKNKRIKYIGKSNMITKKKNGFGIIIYDDDSQIFGVFSENRVNGSCKFINTRTNSTYGGRYKNNIPYGYGYYENKNGFKEGFWYKNFIIDIGIEFHSNSSYYQGEYKRNKYDGVGLFRFPDGTIYQGEFSDNQMNGYGIFLYEDRMYEGEVLNGMKNGLGIFTWKNGNKYIGFYESDLKNGFGMFLWTFKPLVAYIGFWSKGKPNGVGINLNGNNAKYSYFKNGKREILFKNEWEIKNHLNGKQNLYKKILLKNPFNTIKHFFGTYNNNK
jgi:hypothetical protein